MNAHRCDYCGQTYRWQWSAATCCDPISNDLDDELDLDGSHILRSTD